MVQVKGAAIVLSAGYEDDIDLGDEIIYIGAGGNDSGKQVEDQLWTNKGNAGLLKSQNGGRPIRVIHPKVFWTDTKNALIELIYALYTNGSLSDGKIGIRKISLALERMFQISLGDLHHSFHRMKYRAGSRTAFLDQLKSSLEEYMDKDL